MGRKRRNDGKSVTEAILASFGKSKFDNVVKKLKSREKEENVSSSESEDYELSDAEVENSESPGPSEFKSDDDDDDDVQEDSEVHDEEDDDESASEEPSEVENEEELTRIEYSPFSKIFHQEFTQEQIETETSERVTFYPIESKIDSQLRIFSSKKDFDNSIAFTDYENLYAQYMDVWISHRDESNADVIRKGYCAHIMNHMIQTRNNIIENSNKLKMNQLQGQSMNKDEDDDLQKDQGFTRPKVLILVPFKADAFKVLYGLIEASPDKYKREISNKKRFNEEFGPPEMDATQAKQFESKPRDYQFTFDGNIDDCFRVGISMHNRGFKIYTEFYSSDIIIASPLGLRMVTGAPGDRDRDIDFLSSIEILVFDCAEVMSMQNFEHVHILMNEMNRIPKESHGADFSRIRDWYLNGWAKYYRQTIISSGYINPDLNVLFNKYCNNIRGKIKIKEDYHGKLNEVVPKVRQIFQRFDVDSLKLLDDIRFNFFSKEIFPKYKVSGNERTLVFISSYFDYVRVRNYFKELKIDFGVCCEYSERKIVDKSRTLFNQGKIQYLVVTERFYFFRRYKLRGYFNILFYSPPESPQFYLDLLNGLEAYSDHTSLMLYCKYDSNALERIVGSERAVSILSSTRSTHMFC